MKLRMKSLIIISLTCLGFISGLTLFSPIILNTIYLSIFMIAFAVCIYVLSYIFIIKRIEKAAQASPFKNTKGKDEAELMQLNINKLTQELQTKNEDAEKNMQHQIQYLKNINAKLHQEITEMSKETKTTLTEGLTTSRNEKNTGLPNRYYFNDILNKAIKYAGRRNQLLAVLSIDINNFTDIINTIGIKNSNRLLFEVGNRFSNVLRSEDILAKLDADEFIVLLADINQAKFAGAVAEKLLRVCQQKFKIDHHELAVAVSIGISIFPNDGTSLENLISSANTALFNAKHETDKSKGCYTFFTKEMNNQAHEYTLLEKELRHAIKNRELTLFYQPKFSVKQGKIAGVETLLRWEHPELGLISPAKFIPVAEECGLIIPIGEWLLQEACAMNKHWQDAGYEHFTIAVNLSAKQFNHVGITETINKVLRETGLNAKYLELEITEKTAMTNIAVTEKILTALKATGVQLSLDHFGTGYTSITHLKQFSISAVKIDQNFIKGVPNNPNDAAITSAFIGLAHNLGLEVIAEGVETPEQMQFLTTQDCDMVQGYYLSHPLPAQKVELQFNKLRDKVLV